MQRQRQQQGQRQQPSIHTTSAHKQHHKKKDANTPTTGQK